MVGQYRYLIIFFQTKRSHYQYVEVNTDGEETPISPEDNNRRYSRRMRKAPLRMDDEETRLPKRPRRRRRHVATNVTHIVITPLDEPQDIPFEFRPQLVEPSSQSLGNGEIKTEKCMPMTVIAETLEDTDVLGMDLMQSVIKPEESNTFDQNQIEEDVDNLLPIIAAAENSERQDHGGFTIAEKLEAERIAKG
jgi:hypothetical protein